MSQPCYVFIPGLYSPEDVTLWSVQAEVWCRKRGLEARSFNYLAGTTTALTYDPKIARLLALRLREIINDGLTPTPVTHSNGGRVMSELIKQFPEFVYLQWWAFAPWLTRDCRKNYMNAAAERSPATLSKVTIFASNGDTVLKTFASGSGDLGMLGPDMATVSPKLMEILDVVRHDQYDHSDWVTKYLTESLRAVTGVE